MENSWMLVLVITICGAISTMIGGIIGGAIKIKSDKSISVLFEFTAGMMTAIICTELLPNAFKSSGIIYSLIAIVIGIIFTGIIDIFTSKISKNNKHFNEYIGLALLMLLSMSFDNISEGLAVSGSFMLSFDLGLSVILAISLHNIPEGMAMAASMNVAKLSLNKIIIASIVVGIFLGIGSIIGVTIGSISEISMGMCLAVSGGAMIYIVSCDLLSKSRKMHSSKLTEFIYIIGVIMGTIISLI